MEIVVQKFGGSSVANKEKLEFVIKNIEKAKGENKSVVVVVSAQGKTTDELILKSQEYILPKEKIENNKNENKIKSESKSEINNKTEYKDYTPEMDMLLSTGEMQTVSLLTMMLKEKNIKAVGLTGGQAGIITDSKFSKASIITILPENILKLLAENMVVVVAGFQGIDKFGRITTLGRGGSDLSAVAIAASLNAQKCEIYTDVDGIYSADPKVIQNAKLLDSISYEEMLDGASAGAKVLHDRSVSVAKKYNLPIYVKSTQNSKGGSKVMNEEKINLNENINIEKYTPKLLAIEKDLVKISIVGNAMLSNMDYLGKIYDIASESGVKIYMVSCNESVLGIVVKANVAEKFANDIHDKIIL